MSAPRKQEKDYGPEVKALLPEAEALAGSGKLTEAVDKIAGLEKQTRNASDMNSTATLLTLMTRLIYESGDLELLNTQFVALSKKHGQLKEAVVRMVDEAIKWLDPIRASKGDAAWLELLETLRGITEGKIYLELARARLTVLLARNHEKIAESAPSTSSTPAPKPASTTTGDNKKAEKPKPVTAKEHFETAADLMSDIQVETYSSMDKREKTEFILDQMRLESLRGNWIKVRVGSRKINRAFLKEPESSDIKLRYYELMIRLALQDDAYLEACQAYQEVWDTEEIKADEAKARDVLENIFTFVVLAPYDNEQSDMLHKLYADQSLAKDIPQRELVKCFITKELMRWPGIEQLYGPEMRQSYVFQSAVTKKEDGTEIDDGSRRWEELHKRVIEHNIRVIATYYSRVTLNRLTELLDLSAIETERTLCKLVTDKTIYARIDRPTGIVTFKPKQSINEVLNAWSADVDKMLGLVEKTSHLVAKEYAMHEAARGKKGIKA